MANLNNAQILETVPSALDRISEVTSPKLSEEGLVLEVLGMTIDTAKIKNPKLRRMIENSATKTPPKCSANHEGRAPVYEDGCYGCYSEVAYIDNCIDKGS
jgi:hypothetical protein